MSATIAPRLAPVRLELPEFADARGSLCSAEADRHVPFPVERVYWITAVPPDAFRGGHAHRTVTEMLVAVAGRFRVRWEGPDGSGEVVLRAPRDAIVLPPLLWRRVDRFAAGAVCLVLASGPYDAAEYVTDPRELQQLHTRA